MSDCVSVTICTNHYFPQGLTAPPDRWRVVWCLELDVLLPSPKGARQGSFACSWKLWGTTLKEPRLILGVGELLWDMLPQGPQLGGAPANFTVMAGRLGNHAAILSRIGRDDLGRKAVSVLDPLPVDTSHLQVDPAHETGRVTVILKQGQPEYVIHQPAAWDFLELSDDWLQLAERADAICFGSLAQRSLESRQTIQTLAAQTSSTCVRVYDVNLRAPFYSGEIVQESLELATVVKMNDAEVPLVLALSKK